MHTHTPITGLQFIGGEWIASSQRTFVSRNPAWRDEFVGVFPVASAAEVTQAISAAKSAFPAWRDTDADERAALLIRLGELLRRDADRLATLITRESGRVIADARDEVAACARFANRASAWLPAENQRPRGVAAVVTPWTFPLGMPVGMLIPALAAGNTAVLKPSENAPAVAQRVVEMFIEVGLPPGVLNLLHGDGYVGESLARSPHVDAILFAGRVDVARRLRQLSLEMPGRGLALSAAGKAAMLICRDAELPGAVAAAAVSVFRSAGQRCDSIGRILVAESILDEFIDRFVEVVAALPVGDPLKGDAVIGPVVSERDMETALAYQQLAKQEGAEFLLDGGRAGEGSLDAGCYLAPFACCVRAGERSRLAGEPIAGPLVAITPFRELDQAIDQASGWGDTLAAFTRDVGTRARIRAAARCRVGLFNRTSLSDRAFLSLNPSGESPVARSATWLEGTGQTARSS